MMKKLILCCALFSAVLLPAQQTVNDQLYARGIEMLKVRNDNQAFPIFQLLLKSDSANVKYLQYTAYLYSRIGYHQVGQANQTRYYRVGEYLAKKAIALDEKSPDAHFAYALALGRLTENASSKEKLAIAKLLKKEADRVVELDPKHAGAWHVLGRWHRELANIGSFEKAMINTFFGGMPPGASYDKAIECFNKCIAIENDCILHHYELANTYYQMGNKEKCRTHLNDAMRFNTGTTIDKDTFEKCEALKKSLD